MAKFQKVAVIALLVIGPTTTVLAAERTYDLVLKQTTVNFTGRDVSHAISVNDTIPGPTLRFDYGDMAIIKVTNQTKEPTNMHWHGLLVPFNMDGPVPNNKPIQPGDSFTFRFPIKQTGTYWYHAHSTLHEQVGLYGSIVIADRQSRFKTQDDLVLVLSDWIDEHPEDVLGNLKKEGSWYAFKKDFLPSWLGAIRHGAVWDYIKSQWTRMGAMDLSDIGYDAFLVNGKRRSAIERHYMPGDKIRLRVINAGASTYFYVNIGKLQHFHAIAKDGVDVVPVPVNEILIGMGETYDLLFTVPHHGAFEFRATPQDITGKASLILGQGELESVPDKVKPNPYKMEHSGHGEHSSPPDSGDDQSGHDGHGNQVVHARALTEPADASEMPQSHRLQYEDLVSTVPTAFDLTRHATRDISLELTGDMERYHWFINGRPFSEEQYIHIREGEVVRFQMVNKTMMHHPMHLHGHFFRVLNGQENYSPLFHTIDMAPGKTYTVEFLANEPGIWVFHCHNLYHMKMGMMRLVKYEGFSLPLTGDYTAAKAAAEHSLRTHVNDDKKFYPRYSADLFSGHAELEVGLNGGRYDVSLRLEVNEWEFKELEGETLFKRYLSNFLSVYAGASYKDQELKAIVGLAYQLPLQVVISGYSSVDGKVTVRITKSIPLTDRILLDPKVEFDSRDQWTFEKKLLYRLNNNVGIGTFYQYNTETRGHVTGVGISVKF